MPSVTDLPAASAVAAVGASSSSKNSTSSTPPPQAQASFSNTTNNSSTAAAAEQQQDPLTQAVLALEKRQRNLVKRKDRLESYEKEAATGKELNKDQKEALEKKGEVIGQMQFAKELHEQFKSLRDNYTTAQIKNQKRAQKAQADEKRQQLVSRVREFIQLRFLLDHRPTTLSEEESIVLDELARLLIPHDASSINKAVETYVALYGGLPTSTSKSATFVVPGKTANEVRDIIEHLVQSSSTSATAGLVDEVTITKQTPQSERQEQQEEPTPQMPSVPPSTPASVLPQRKQNNNNGQQQQHAGQQQQQPMGSMAPPPPPPAPIHSYGSSETPIQLDTRQASAMPLHELLEYSPYFDVGSLQGKDGNVYMSFEQTAGASMEETGGLPVTSPDPTTGAMKTCVFTNSNMPPSTVGPAGQATGDQGGVYGQQQQGAVSGQHGVQHQQDIYDQDNRVQSAGSDEQQQQQHDEQWQQRSGRGGRGGNGQQQQYPSNGNQRQRGQGNIKYTQQQQQYSSNYRQGPRTYEGGNNYPRAQYNENNAQQRGGGQQQQQRGNAGGGGGGYRGQRGSGGNSNYPRGGNYQQQPRGQGGEGQGGQPQYSSSSSVVHPQAAQVQ